MKTSEFSFKVFGTCLVLVIALSIFGWIIGGGVWNLVTFIGTIGGIALVIAIVALIWEG